MSDGTGWTPPVDPAAGGHLAGPPPPGTGPPAPPGGPAGHWGTAAPPRWGEQNSPWGAPPVSKPGVIPLRPLAVGEVLDGAFSVIRHYPKVTLGMSAIVVVVTQLLVFLVTFSDVTSDSYDTGGPFEFNGSQILGWIIGDIGAMVLAALLAPVMAQAVLGRPVTFGTSWQRVRPVLAPLLVLAVIAGGIPWLGLFALALPGAFLWGVWALAAPALVMERTTIGGALRRSWRLALPDFWRVWGIRALSFVIEAVLGTIVALPIAFVGGYLWARGDYEQESDLIFVVVLLLAAIAANVITMPFAAGVLALLYIDRRMRAEGLDVTLAQSAATQGGGFAPGTGSGYGGGYGGDRASGWPPAGPR